MPNPNIPGSDDSTNRDAVDHSANLPAPMGAPNGANDPLSPGDSTPTGNPVPVITPVQASAPAAAQEAQAAPRSASAVGVASSVDAASADADERSKRALSRVSIVVRAVLFILACVLAVVGVMGMARAADTQSASRQTTTESIRGNTLARACVIFSYDDSDASVAVERDGVASIFDSSGVSYDMFYLDARSAESKNVREGRLSETIMAKGLAAGGYDVVIAAGDEALAYVLDERSLFEGIPTAFFAVDDEVLAESAQASGLATGYVDYGAAALSLEEACKLAPKAQNAVVLVDGSVEANGLLAQLEEASQAGKAGPAKLDVWDVSKITRDKLAERLAGLGDDSLVLLLAANHDSQKNSYTPSDTAHFIAANAKVPAFAALGGVGEGLCGAAFIDRQNEGVETSKLAVSLLNGSAISTHSVQKAEPICCAFDAKALEAHGIDPNATPNNATVINEPSLSWRAIRPYAVPILHLVLAIVCIAAFGVIGFRRSVQSTKDILDSYNDLQHRLFHDLLTDLPNRHALDEFLLKPPADARLASLVKIDICDFTDINDSYGHAVGDGVIEMVANRLRGIDTVMLARSGGDEFSLIFDQYLEPNGPELAQIKRVFDEPAVVGDAKIELQARMGVANRSETSSNTDLAVCGDLAMHNAKDDNLFVPVFYDESMRADMERKLEITAYLKQAIAEETVNVVWQPQVDVETLKVTGFEALCRLEGNKYFPGEFVPVAEMSGLVIPLDRLVTKKVITQLGIWLKEGREVPAAAINFSVAQLRDAGYCDFLAGLMEEHGVPGSLVKVEITESMMLGNEDEAERLFARLRTMGIRLALDDFGTGYSSLDRMATKSINIVKLDKSLVDAFMVPGKEGFIDDVTRLIHGLGKSIIVEGVETREQYDICHALGCDVIQGYFFARPLPADEAIAFDPKQVMA